MINAISCCCLFVQGRAQSNAPDFVVTKLIRDSQQHELLKNRKDCKVYPVATISVFLASSDEC